MLGPFAAGNVDFSCITQVSRGNTYDETFWFRKQHTRELTWTVSSQQKRHSLEGGAELRITPRPSIGNEGDVVTITLLNSNIASDDLERLNAESLFQPSIRVELRGANRFATIERNSGRITDQEVIELDMLYSHVQCYAQGHGCSVLWDVSDEAPRTIESTFLPTYSLFQMMPAKANGRRLFNMKFLAEASSEDILRDGTAYIEEYRHWIDNLESKTVISRFLIFDVAMLRLIHCIVHRYKHYVRRARGDCYPK